jgi:predicted O-methyltransferase YrrM
MPLARTYDQARRAITVTLEAGYRDRLARDSDIQEYMPFLREQAASRPGCRVLELGTRKGNSTLAFLAGAEVSDGHVWSCDVSPVTRDPEGMAPWRKAARWTFLQGDDMDPAVQTLLPARCDLLFIDTSHEYDHTLAELRTFMPRVRPWGGIALFHDTHLMGWPGYQWDRDVSPVWAALDDYCAETGLTWEDMPGHYGLGVIRP